MRFYVYNPDGERIGILSNYSSMQWVRRYSHCGQFELHAPHNPHLFQPEYLIVKGNEAAIIESIVLNGDMAEIRGRFILGYYARRIVWDSIAETDTAENIILKMCADNDRGLDIVMPEVVGYENTLEYEGQFGNVLDEITTIAEGAELGLNISYPAMQLHIYRGPEKRVVFSDKLQNTLSQEYMIDTTQYINTVTDGTETIGTETGRSRREGYQEENPELLLAENKVSESFTAEINPYVENAVYLRDYDLGDIVNIKSHKWGIITQARITEINEIYENNGMKISVVFGYEKPIKLLR